MDAPSPETIEGRFELARTAAREAGELALGYFRDRDSLRLEIKSNAQDVVSIADKEAETRIRTMIERDYPGDGMLGEEHGRKSGNTGYTWVMDPIDGTSAFVSGIPAWCVSIALMKEGQTIAGAVYDPVNAEMFAASSPGAFMVNDRPHALDRSLTLENGLIGIGANHRVASRLASEVIDRLLNRGGMFVRSGSGALMLAYVAAGRLAGYYEPHMNAWDCLAGLHLVERAGGWAGAFPTGETMLDGGPVMGAGPGTKDDLLAILDEKERGLLIA